jgi:hypothetical protein
MDFWIEYGPALAAVAVIIAIAVRIRWRVKNKKPGTTLMTAEEATRLDWELVPKCVCGEMATEPAPVLQRTRGAYDFMRKYFAAAPKYKRVIDLMRPPTFCKAHVHVADAKLDQFIFAVRSEYAALNSKVSADAAAFEQESLRIFVADSLTDKQKLETRKPRSALRVLPQKTGTDDPVSEG